MSGPWGRSGDHLFLLYTGGTTGMPKGVMWRQDDLFGVLDANNRRRMPPEQDLDAATPAYRDRRPAQHARRTVDARHRTLQCVSNLMVGGSITTMQGRSFTAEEFLDDVERYGINSTSIVGDAFAKPILRALDAEPDRWDISLAAGDRVVRGDVVEGDQGRPAATQPAPDHGRRARIVARRSAWRPTRPPPNRAATRPRFELGPNTRVVTDDGRDVTPGSDELGRVALRGRTPIGYYKDEQKSADTFVVIDGDRYSIPGD